MLSACGVTEFWTPVRPPVGDDSTGRHDDVRAPLTLFTGQLKQQPKDFVVMELDPRGQCTAVDEGGASPFQFDPPSVRGGEGSDDVAPPETSPVPSAPVEATDDLLSCLTDTSLEAALGSDVDVTERALHLDRRELGEVVAALFPTRCPVPALAATATTLPTVARSWWRASMPLPAAPAANKKLRRLVHMAVRHRYPHIRTAVAPSTFSATESSSPSVVSPLAAAVDLHYVFLTAALGEEVARCVAQWAAMEGEKNATPEELDVLSELDHRVARCCAHAAKKSAPPLLVTAHFREVPSPASETAPTSFVLSEKDVRRSFHELRQRFYPYVACTVQDGRVRLRYAPRVTAANDAPRRRPRDEAPHTAKSGENAPLTHGSSSTTAAAASASTPAFTYLLIRKCNVETAEMKKLIAEHLSVPEGSVCIAGMKDKKGITFQRCSVPGDHVHCLTRRDEAQQDASSPSRPTPAAAPLVSPQPAAALPVRPPVVLRWPTDPLGSTVEITHCAAHPFASPIHIGQLGGNRFRVRLRNVVWHAPPSTPSLTAAAGREALANRFHAVAARGFLNYFGQQRFSESVESLADHTGVHLFAHRYVQAVRSLYRGCPSVYDAFPDKMEARFVPGNARDAQAMTHALRQTYRMYFSEHTLRREDVEQESALWQQICTKAIVEGTAFSLRAMWVHAAQSLYFNVCASYIASHARSAGDRDASSPTWQTQTLPLAGYQTVGTSEAQSALWPAAHTHALRLLELTREQLLTQRRVAGVPVPGTPRALLAVPTEASLVFEDADAETEVTPLLSSGVPCGHAVFSFSLPPSCYATVFLREVLGNDEWW